MQVKPLELPAMASLEAMNPAELLDLARKGQRIGERQKQYTEAHKQSFKALGKIVAAAKKAYVRLQNAGIILDSVPFKKWFEDNTGAPPNNHAESLALAWNSYVETGAVTEREFDLITSRCLEKAATIVNEAKNELQHAAVKAAAAALKSPAADKDKYETLTEILDGLKGPKVLEYEKALELCEKLTGAGYASTMIAHVQTIAPALAADTENNRRKCKAVYQQLVRLMFAFNGSAAADGLLDAETVIAWTDEVESDLRKAANAAAGQSAVPIVNAEVEDLEAAAA
jgi:hypothetical protein